MKYWIETVGDQLQIGKQIHDWKEQGLITIEEKADVLQRVENDLIKIGEAFKRLEDMGINQSLMIAYLRDKGIAKSTAREVLKHEREFYKKIGLIE